MSTRIKTNEVRFSFCHLFEPSQIAGQGDPKYSLAILIPKTDRETLAKIKEAYETAKQEGAEKFGKVFTSKCKTPLVRVPGTKEGLLRDADKEEEIDTAYAGHYILNLKSTNAPQVLARETGTKVLDKEEGERIVYSGCYGKVTLSIFAYNNGQTGIGAALNNVFKTRDGERFGGYKSAAEDFGDELDMAADALGDAGDAYDCL